LQRDGKARLRSTKDEECLYSADKEGLTKIRRGKKGPVVHKRGGGKKQSRQFSLLAKGELENPEEGAQARSMERACPN